MPGLPLRLGHLRGTVSPPVPGSLLCFHNTALATFPLSYWVLGELSGAVTADETGAHVGAYVNTPELGLQGLLPYDNATAVRFSGSPSEYVDITGYTAVPAQGSIWAWIKGTTFSDNGIAGWFAGNATDLAFYLPGGDAVRFYAGTTPVDSGGVPVITNGLPHFVVGTYDGVVSRLYVDGLLAAGPTAVTHTGGASANSFKIAQYGAPSGLAIDATIGQVGVNDYPLGSAQIEAMYAARLVPCPGFVPALSWDSRDEQQDRTTVQQWFIPDPSTEGLTPPAAAAFDPAPFAGLFGSDTSQDRPTVERWFAPEAAVEGFIPRDPAPIHPDPGVDITPNQSTAQLWFAPEPSVEGLTPRDSGPTHPDPNYDSSLDRWTAQLWFAPEAAVEGLTPPAGAAFDPAPFAGAWQPGPPELVGPAWVVPPDGADPLLPPLVAPTAAQLAGAWQEQYDGATPAPWLFADTLIGIDTTPGFDPSTVDWGLDSSRDRWNAQQWFAPEAAVEGFVPIVAAAAFDPATVDWGLDVSRDRSTQPVWILPEPPAEGFVPILNPVLNTAQLAPLWAEQPVAWRDGTPWYNPVNNPVDPPFGIITYPAPGTIPGILFDVDSGDVFIYLGGNAIVPAR